MMRVSINKQLRHSPNWFGVLSRLCQEEGYKTFSFQMSLRTCFSWAKGWAGLM